MREQLSKNKIKEMIRYWIEVRHICNSIDVLIEDTDEIGENYEFKEWLKYDQTGEGTSIMDVQTILKTAYEKCFDIMEVLDGGLEGLLQICREQLPEIFGKYTGMLQDTIISLLAEELLETAINEIYDYHMDKQYENFCGIVQEICGRLCKSK